MPPKSPMFHGFRLSGRNNDAGQDFKRRRLGEPDGGDVGQDFKQMTQPLGGDVVPGVGFQPEEGSASAASSGSTGGGLDAAPTPSSHPTAELDKGAEEAQSSAAADGKPPGSSAGTDGFVESAPDATAAATAAASDAAATTPVGDAPDDHDIPDAPSDNETVVPPPRPGTRPFTPPCVVHGPPSVGRA